MGTKNPLFETAATWDLLLDINTGRMVVGKDIHSSYPGSGPAQARMTRGDSFSSMVDEDIGRGPPPLPRDTAPVGSKSQFSAQADNPDNVFIEDVIAAISYHYGETLVRSRFTQYVMRFSRLASRYEELTAGATKTGFASFPFVEGPGDFVRLGSGMMFVDEVTGSRELTANASRVEAWKRTKMYEHYAMVSGFLRWECPTVELTVVWVCRTSELHVRRIPYRASTYYINYFGYDMLSN